MEQKAEVLVGLLADKREMCRIDGLVIGVLIKAKDSETFFVNYPANPSASHLPARSTVPMDSTHIGREVVLMFEEGDPTRPVILGVIQNRASKAAMLLDQLLSDRGNQIDVQVDEERLVLSAQKEVVIKCGEASITLTKAGKILIRGTYVLSSSSGVNRIKGGSVQIN